MGANGQLSEDRGRSGHVCYRPSTSRTATGTAAEPDSAADSNHSDSRLIEGYKGRTRTGGAAALSTAEEAQLIDRARHGDVRAFEALYRLHCARVHGLCLRLADNRADAEDATQETFIRAWNALAAFRGESAFSTWLHRIAFNEVIGRKRRHATERRHLEIADAPSDSVTTPGPDAGTAEELERIERAIRKLPERARQALVLHRIYGYTHGEAAAFMGVAAGTCKAQVHRALRLLRDALGHGEDAADRSTASPPARSAAFGPETRGALPDD